MTGLERVRDYIGKYAPNPTKAMHVLEDLDAHEKEDAEKAADALAVEGQLHEKWTELEAEVSKWKMRCLTRDGECIKLSVELGRLREELDLKDGLLNQAKGELDRLRPMEHKYAEALEREAVIDIENDRLREQLKDHIEGFCNIEAVARLRKELERSRQDDSEWKATIERTNAENARLREKLTYAQGGQYVAVMQENARLREAIEDYFEHDDVRPLYDVYQEKKP